MFSIIELKIIGQYYFDTKKRTHTIRISPKKNKTVLENSVVQNVFKVKTVDSEAEKYQLISTVLHEIKHALQKEERGIDFWNAKYSCASDIKNNSLKDFYSECEIEARTFEHTNMLNAVETYNNFLAK